MSDLIKREGVIVIINKWFDFIKLNPDILIDSIKSIPTAEPKVGKWKIETEGNGWNEWHVFTCPFCGARIKDNMGYHEWKFNFCPNCGAKMKRSE